MIATIKKALRRKKGRVHLMEGMTDLPPHTIGQTRIAIDVYEETLRVLRDAGLREPRLRTDVDARKIARAVGRLVILELSARYGVMVPEDLSPEDRRALARHQRTFKGVG